MAKIGVCLSGCGVNDGAEIHESVITALTLDKAGAEILFTAPNMEQAKVVNHLTGDEMGERRNVLVESARIARGNIIDLAELTNFILLHQDIFLPNRYFSLGLHIWFA